MVMNQIKMTKSQQQPQFIRLQDLLLQKLIIHDEKQTEQLDSLQDQVNFIKAQMEEMDPILGEPKRKCRLSDKRNNKK